jgi:diguanylate cyclase (GGDEF)-like protein
MAKLNLADHLPCPPVKKIWNREYAAQRLAAELAHLDRDSGYRFAVVMVEVAGFSPGVANRLGYASSNEIWPKVLAFLTNDLGPEGICSRLGEEEFLLILPGANAEKANALADLLRRRWADTAFGAVALEVTVAAAAWVARGGTIQAVFAVVDQALDEERQRKHHRAEEWRSRPHDRQPLAGRARAVLTGNS